MCLKAVNLQQIRTLFHYDFRCVDRAEEEAARKRLPPEESPALRAGPVLPLDVAPMEVPLPAMLKTARTTRRHEAAEAATPEVPGARAVGEVPTIPQARVPRRTPGGTAAAVAVRTTLRRRRQEPPEGRGPLRRPEG